MILLIGHQLRRRFGGIYSLNLRKLFLEEHRKRIHAWSPLLPAARKQTKVPAERLLVASEGQSITKNFRLKIGKAVGVYGYQLARDTVILVINVNDQTPCSEFNLIDLPRVT